MPHILRGGGEVASDYADALEPTEERLPDRQTREGSIKGTAPFSRETGGSYECKENARGSMACLDFSPSEKCDTNFSLPQKYLIERSTVSSVLRKSVVFRWRIMSIRIPRKPALE